MDKKGKITAKHFLNTNLKPYVVKEINYYSVYILLTAQRKNTRIKSIVFNEYYSGKSFENITSSKEYENLRNQEISSLETITSIVIDKLKDFDPRFTTSYFNFSTNISIKDIDVSKFEKELKEVSKEISLYQFFAIQNQEKLKKYLIGLNNETDVNNTLENINKTIFCNSLDKFKWFLSGGKRNRELLKKMSFLFNSHS